MWYKTRLLVPRRVKSILRAGAHFTFVSDLRSLRAYRASLALDGSFHETASTQTTLIGIRQLGHRLIEIRTGTTDANVVFSAFCHRFHLPPPDFRMPPAPVIWDLGANIGVTMAHFASRYPRARVVGVELDHANAVLCKRNVAPWSDRCTVVEGAIWYADGEISYAANGNQDAYSVTLTGNTPAERCVAKAPAIALDTLLALTGDPPCVDFVKLDIEGAEKFVLRENTAWASRVRCIKAELHYGYSKAACIADLERLGFRAREDLNHNLCVVGVRRGD